MTLLKLGGKLATHTDCQASTLDSLTQESGMEPRNLSFHNHLRLALFPVKSGFIRWQGEGWATLCKKHPPNLRDASLQGSISIFAAGWVTSQSICPSENLSAVEGEIHTQLSNMLDSESLGFKDPVSFISASPWYLAQDRSRLLCSGEE